MTDTYTLILQLKAMVPRIPYYIYNWNSEFVDGKDLSQDKSGNLLEIFSLCDLRYLEHYFANVLFTI